MFREVLKKAMAAYGMTADEGQFNAFSMYYEQLMEWNQKINLTAIVDPEGVAVKHMIDSLSCYERDVFPTGCKVVDVGTGAGFPGLPLKIMHEDQQLTLLDSLNKRVKFLTELSGALGLKKVQVLHRRAEEGARDQILREQYDVATARAVARLRVLAELCMPFVRVGGYFVALKGAQYEEEILEAKRAISVLGGRIARVKPVTLPNLEDVRAVIYIRKIKKTPFMYPRKAGTPEKNPL